MVPLGFAHLVLQVPSVGYAHGCPGKDGRVPLGLGCAWDVQGSFQPARGLGSTGGTGQPCLTWTGSLLEAGRGYALKQNALKLI